jgi:hypothetical protein
LYFEWRWREDLPSPTNKSDEASYVGCLSGRPARHTLAAVLEFFERRI